VTFKNNHLFTKKFSHYKLYKYETMKHSKSLLIVTSLFFVLAGASACSKQEKPQKKTEDANLINVTMYENPNCKCCSKWVPYMEEYGFSIKEVPSNNLTFINTQYKVPGEMQSCHVALIDGYVISGHVPADAIKKLLAERPHAKGLSVPGMQAGAPGVAGDKDTPYNVYLFDGQGHQSVYRSYP